MEPLEQERLASETDLEPNTRLSCQIRVQNDLWVRVINRSSVTGVPRGRGPWTDPLNRQRARESPRARTSADRRPASRSRRHLCFCGSAHFLQRRCAANLAAAARTAVELGLTKFLLARTERHGGPHGAAQRPQKWRKSSKSESQMPESETRQCTRKPFVSSQSKRAGRQATRSLRLRGAGRLV